MSQAKERIYFALGMKEMEDFLKQRLDKEYQFVGEAIYREQVVKNAIPANPDIIILRETLNGSKDILEIVYELRLQLPDARIIFLASDRKPGDPLLAELVSNGVYDIMIGNQISVPSLINLIREPNKFSDVAMLRPKAKINEQTKETVYEAPVREVVKSVKKTIYVEGTPVLPPDYGKNKPKTKKDEKEEPKLSKKRNRRRFRSRRDSEENEVASEEIVETPPIQLQPAPKDMSPPLFTIESEPQPEQRIEEKKDVPPLFEVEPKTEPHPSSSSKPIFDFHPQPKVESEIKPRPEPSPTPIFQSQPVESSSLPVPTSTSNLPSVSSGKQKILTFVGGEHGVGNTFTAFNTALVLGKRGFNTIFIELKEEGSTIEYLYQLSLMDKGLDVALRHLSQENWVGIEKAIIRIAEVRSRNTSSIMEASYKRFPDNVDYLFFSPDFVLEKDPEKKKINPAFLKELCMHLLFQSGYHYIVLDAEPNLFNSFTEVALSFGTHIFFTVTQDVCHIGRAVRHVSEVSKRINITEKLYYIVNKYDEKAALSKKDIEDWLKQEVETTIPFLYRDSINANMNGVPILLYSKDTTLKKAFHEIVDHILKK